MMDQESSAMPVCSYDEPEAPVFSVVMENTLTIKNGGDVVVYEVEVHNKTSSQKWNVLRRYREFDALHQRLTTVYGQKHKLPQPPKKQISLAAFGFGGMTPMQQMARKRDLQAYMNDLLGMGELVKASTELQSFLELHDLARSAATGDLSLVRATLTASPASISKPTHFGGTALHVAAFHGQKAVCQLLLDAGADPSIVDSLAQTPNMVAESAGQIELAAALEARLVSSPDPIPFAAAEAFATANKRLYGVLGNSQPKHFLVVLNPGAGSGTASRVNADVLQPLLTQMGGTAEVHSTGKAGEGTKIVGTALMQDGAGKYDGVICIGGDGLANEACNALVKLQQADPAPPFLPPLTAIPVGGANAFAASAASADIWRSVRKALLGKFQWQDSLRITQQEGLHSFALTNVAWGLLTDAMASGSSQPLLGAGLSLGIRTMKLATDTQRYKCKLVIHKAAEAAGTAAAGAGGAGAVEGSSDASDSKDKECSTEDGYAMPSSSETVEIEGCVPIVFVCKRPFAASNVKVAPLSNPTDGLLDVVAIRDYTEGPASVQSQATFLKSLGYLMAGSTYDNSAIDYFKATKVVIMPEPYPVIPFSVDGEVQRESTALEVTVVSKAIRVVI